MQERTCADCGADISARHWRSKRCEACQFERERVAMGARERPLRQHVCQMCGTEFLSTQSRVRYCSHRCSGKGGHPGVVDRTCVVCDVVFSVSRQFDRATCSRKCYAWTVKYPGRKPIRECRWCGGPLNGKALRAEWCDARCWHAAKEGVSWEWIKTRRCIVCNAPMSRDMHYHRVVCSDLCADRRPRSPETIFRQTHARRKNMNAAKVYRVPKAFIRRLRTLPCFYCGKPGGTADHVVPISRGGKHAEGNLVPACRSCNSSKGDRLLVEWRRKRARLVA